jgi:disulfide bond formation protein DsbB
VLAFLFAVTAAIGVYHAGIEWKFWAGPAACAAATLAQPGDILSSLKEPVRVVACDEAPSRLLGISLAGYNALIGAALALFALSVARARG